MLSSNKSGVGGLSILSYNQLEMNMEINSNYIPDDIESNLLNEKKKPSLVMGAENKEQNKKEKEMIEKLMEMNGL
jgi:hypothetical protein